MRWGSIISACIALATTGCLDRELTPLNPCLVSNVIDEVQSRRIDKVDLLFVIDNSGSMAEEQASLAQELPTLMRALATGDRDRDGLRDFEPVVDLHLGVVSTDLGVPGAVVDTCDTYGDNGALQHAPRAEGCNASYPSFLTYRAGDDPEALARDFGCIARLGTQGCGIEQQLEASLKALWPSVDIDPATGQARDPNRITFLGTSDGVGQQGRGDLENVGFLRNEADDTSILAVVLVTDEEDCSMKTTEDLRTLPQDQVNLRCFQNQDALLPVSRYVDDLRLLRSDPDLVLFAAIVGVPETLVSPDVLTPATLKNDAAREAFYDHLLSVEEMQQRIDPVVEPMHAPNLIPSCRSDRGKAYPPRRIVEVARGFGENGIVQSICQASFAPAIDAIVRLIAGKITSLCLPRALVRDSRGTVDCDIVWELPLPAGAPAGTPTRCIDHPLLEPLDAATATRGERCRVPQLGLTSEAAVLSASSSTSGWYYDDFMSNRVEECGTEKPQRLAFTQNAQPPNGVKVKLECLDEHTRAPTTSSTRSASTTVSTIGSPCDQIDAAGNVISNDAVCSATMADGTALPMFCHPQDNVCVQACSTDSECPPSWRCDARPETIATTQSAARPMGSAICVNPTCDSPD